MAAPKIALRKIDDLTPDPRNARTHSPEQIEQLVASISRFGWTNPVLADDLIRAGHGRVQAARLIYEQGGTIHMAPGAARGGKALPTGTVPVIDCTGWSDDERKAYSLADNQLALQAGWDLSLLTEQLDELTAADFSLVDIGFDQAALDALQLGRPAGGKTDPDEVPEPPEDPVTRLGDVWAMGGHRLICGDSTDPGCVAQLLDGEQPHLMVTDPPYGVKYDADWRNHTGDLGRSARAVGKVMNDDRADWTEAWELFRGDVAYVWHAGNHAHEVAASLISTGLEIRAQIIWNKNMLVIGRGDYHPKHEPCWYAVRKGKKGHFDGGRKQTTVWDIDKPQKSETGHSTQKPVECMKRPVENNSRPGDAVYEPFSGSFTTGIACEMTGRRCLAIELNPAYVDLGVARWEAFTGQQATLVGDGRTFADVARERLGSGTEAGSEAEGAQTPATAS